MKKQIVRKSNDLVEARFKFDLYEMRLFLKMVSMVKMEDQDFQVYRVYLRDLAQDFELGNSAYERIREAARRLMSKIITLYLEHDLGIMRFETPVVVGLGSFDKGVGERFIEVSFHPNLKPHLLNLKSRFLLYDMRNILRLPSTYSIRMYELLKQYERIGKRRFRVDDLKEILGVTESYPLYGNFKQRVLDKAKKDLEDHTDIRFTYEEVKQGKMVTELVFLISRNGKPAEEGSERAADLTPVVQADEALVQEIHTMVSNWVSETTVKEWLTKYPTDQVRRGVGYTLNQLTGGMKIENVGGYLSRMVGLTTLIDLKEIAKKESEERKARQHTADEKRQTLEQRKTDLMRAISEAENRIIAEILTDATVFQEVFDKVKSGRWGSFFEPEKSDRENYQTVMTVRAAVNNEVKSRFAQRFQKMKEHEELERVTRALMSA
ncbi:MAG: replication initiation protein [Bacteroidota bacterium]